jgi:hypothetical protein
MSASRCWLSTCWSSVPRVFWVSGADRVAAHLATRLDDRVPLREDEGSGLGRRLRVGELGLLLMKRSPRLQIVDEAVHLGGLHQVHVRAVGAFRQRFMLIHHRLHPSLGITTGPDQVLARVVHFVLREFHLCACEIELVGLQLALGSLKPARDRL